MLENDTKLIFEDIPVGEYVFQSIGAIEQKKQTNDLSIFDKYLPTYSDGNNYDKIFEVKDPAELTATPTITNNLCYGAKEGSIKVTVSGGTPSYRYIKEGTNEEIHFTGKSFTINSLAAGTYKFRIKDSRNCPEPDGVEVIATITEPTPIEIVNENIAEEDANGNENPRAFKTNVSGFGLKNGKIRAEITEGTPFSNPSIPYQVVLTTDKGVTVASALTEISIQNHFIVHYNQLEKGNYTLTITDSNGCTESRNIFIDEPDPLIVTLSEKKSISCNPANDDPNNDSKLNNDGEISATVSGGVPFKNGVYKYVWYRLEGSQVQRLFGEEKTIENLTEGVYQVAIEDKKGNKTTGTITLKFPERLSLTTESSEIRCSAPTSGTAKAHPKGGTPPYTYQWSDGQTSQTATGLSVGKYFVVVSDSKGCSVQAQVVLSYPDAAKIDNEQVTQLTCYGDQNGSVSVTTSGGKGRVSHTWYDASGNIITQGVSQNGKTIKNLSAGTYKIVLRDEGDCPAIEKTFEIVQPQKLQLSIEREITLCQGDSYTFDLEGQIPNATYRWTDNAGDYYVEATNLAGCKTAEKIVVKQSSQVLDIDFLVATTSYYDYTLKLINLSKKTDALQWQFPDNVIIVQQDDQQAEVRFSKEGTYKVGLKGSLGDCNKVIYKTLFVEKDRIGIQKEPVAQKNIESFLIVPNPNSGSYQLHIKLSKATAIRVRLIDMLGRELFAPEDFPAQSEFILPFNKSNLSAGQYIILLEAGNDVLSQKMIVK
ncbi:T9SS type A sorting domain-containing protein [Capnocytophaga catalasegens]|nr:T9SS type A sorting domain-containing protein [Capnocytophaga catalasegens]